MFRKVVKSTYFRAAEVLTVSGILIVIISNWLGKTEFGRIFREINDTLIPLYIGIVLSFLLCPMYNKLVTWAYNIQKVGDGGFVFDEDHMSTISPKMPIPSPLKDKKKQTNPKRNALRLSKMFASAVCIIAVFGAIALLGYFLLPQLIESIIGLVNSLPQRSEAFVKWFAEHFSRFPGLVDSVNNLTNIGLAEFLQWIQKYVLDKDLAGIAEMISTSLLSVVNVLMDIFIGILIAIYLLNYKERLFAIARKIVAATTTEHRARDLSEFAMIINDTFISFIVGRLLDAAIIWVLTYATMTILGMPEAILISAIVGITNVIPFFGPFIGAIPSTIILLLEDPIQALYFIIMIFVIQQIDGNVIGPRIVGNAIGLGSFWVLLSVLIGGGLFGFIGMALGVPVFAVIYKYVDRMTIKRLRKKEKKTETEDYLSFDKYNIDAKEILND